MHRDDAVITQLRSSAYKIPTASPEADGTIHWNSTTLILVEIFSGEVVGLGYTYGDASLVKLIQSVLAEAILKENALNVASNWEKMIRTVRNIGHPGMASMAISAVDNALWDLKARLLEIPLSIALDAAHPKIPVYGSGGFTTYTLKQIEGQLSGWIEQGITRVKIKIGEHPDQDIERVKTARKAIGDKNELFVDANGAYSRKQALQFAKAFEEYRVAWFEEPVPATDLEGLHLIRDNAPAGMEIAAGEYGDIITYFQTMLNHNSVDVLQADATRCNGITGFLKVGALCEANCLALSAHTAPQLHAHASCAIVPVRPLEYFFDHVRIEKMLFEGTLQPQEGYLIPDRSRIGNGLAFKHKDAEKFKIA